jgi:hypothetical protein
VNKNLGKVVYEPRRDAMNDWYIQWIAEEKRRDGERAFAQQYRLAKEVAGRSLASRVWGEARRIYGSWLVAVGNRLVAVGCRLQARYALSVATPLPEGESAPCS